MTAHTLLRLTLQLIVKRSSLRALSRSTLAVVAATLAETVRIVPTPLTPLSSRSSFARLSISTIHSLVNQPRTHFPITLDHFVFLRCSLFFFKKTESSQAPGWSVGWAYLSLKGTEPAPVLWVKLLTQPAVSSLPQIISLFTALR